MIAHISEPARTDFDDIWLFIAQDSERAADRVISRLENAVRRLLEFPYMGPGREDLAQNLRALRIDNFVIFYRPQGDVLSIERVLHARLDVTSIQF